MIFETESLALLAEALPQLAAGFSGLPAAGPANPSDSASAFAVLTQVANRLQQNYPYFHPLYVGQMLKPPHPVARAAYMLATWLNPNNHAVDGGPASSRMEIEALNQLAAMFGWQSQPQVQHSKGSSLPFDLPLGHLTGGGTFANLEALWIAGQLAPGKIILASDQAHYTHRRISGVLQLPFESIAADSRGRISLDALEQRLKRGDIGTVVATVGTTALGAVDPLPEIVDLRRRYGFRLHVDAAYGGYFTLVSNLEHETTAAFAALPAADSIVIDPHKHGLQPYGCGCVLFRDPAITRFYQHDSPYTYFTSNELHLGEISLECSRSGAAAVALWATQKLLPLVPGGEFARMLESCRSAAIELHRRLQDSPLFLAPVAPQLDIVVWAVPCATIQETSTRARAVFDAAAQRDLHLALVQLPREFFPPDAWRGDTSATQVTCLRSVLMKPEHLAWLDAIWTRLEAAAGELPTPILR